MIDQGGALSCRHSELAVGWALHVLEPAEEALVAAHLPDCPDCTRTVAEAELVGATLGLSLPEQAPSDELEQRVLAITNTAQVRRTAPPQTVPPQTAPQARSRFLRPPAISLPQRPQRQRRSGPGRRDPFCVPEILKLISVALLVFAFAAVLVFFVLP